MQTHLPQWPSLSVSASFLGRFCSNCSYTVLHLFSVELFPTVARGAGLGFCYVVSRVGSASAPYALLRLGAKVIYFAGFMIERMLGIVYTS